MDGSKIENRTYSETPLIARREHVFETRFIAVPWGLVTGTVLTGDGEIAAPTPFSYEREFYDAVLRIGTERLLSDNSLVWVSPDPPKNKQPGRRYLWGHVQMPDKPGTYRVVVKVYPAVRFPHDVNPDRGPAEELYSVDVSVKQASKPPPGVSAT